MRERPSEQDTGLEISLEFFPLAFFVLFCTPRVVIEGREHRRSWGKNFFRLRPGDYQVEVFYPYLWRPECGYATLDVRIQPERIRRINYYHWAFWVFLPGSIRDAGVVAKPSPPGSTTIRWMLGLLGVMLLTPVCCLGGVYVLALIGGRTEAARKEERRVDEQNTQTQIERLNLAEQTARAVAEGKAPPASSLSEAFRKRVPTAELEEQIKRAGPFLVAVGRDDPRLPQERFTFRYAAFPEGRKPTLVFVTVAQENGRWLVDDLRFEDATESADKLLKQRVAERAAEFMNLLAKNLPDSAYYQETTKTINQKPEVLFTGKFKRYLPLQGSGALQSTQVLPEAGGYAVRAVWRATGKNGEPLIFTLTYRRERFDLKVDELEVASEP